MLHLLWGGVIALTAFPFMSLTRRRHTRQRWSQRLLTLLHVHVDIHGAIPEQGCLIVANHISWLDIFVINTLVPAGFIAKSEIRRWPGIGWLAARNDTLFLQRGSRAHARWVNHLIGDRLAADDTIALFPEGATSDGRDVAHFHAMLLQPALDAGHPVQPLALRYRDPHDRYTEAPAYHAGRSLAASFAAILAQPEIRAEAHLLPLERPRPEWERHDFANALRSRIADLVRDPPSAALGTDTDTQQPPT